MDIIKIHRKKNNSTKGNIILSIIRKLLKRFSDYTFPYHYDLSLFQRKKKTQTTHKFPPVA